MSSQKQSFIKGLTLTIGFLVVLVLLFSPLINGHNTIEYLDSLYNSISKGSAYYIPKVKDEVAAFPGRQITVTLDVNDTDQAAQSRRLLEAGGATVAENGTRLTVQGDLNQILLNVLDDADVMYDNDAERIKAKYQYDERRVLFDWWAVLTGLEFELNRQKNFAEAKLVSTVQKRAVETAYNYYGIQSQQIGERVGIVIFSLLFYVIYTLWYGFGILYLFEGFGLNFGH